MTVQIRVSASHVRSLSPLNVERGSKCVEVQHVGTVMWCVLSTVSSALAVVC